MENLKAVTLGELEGRAVTLARTIGQCRHELGRLLEAILAKRMTGEAGAYGHRTIEEFCRLELHMTRKGVNDLIRVSRAYSARDVASYGTKRLLLTLRAGPGRREEVLAMVKRGDSAHRIEQHLWPVASVAVPRLEEVRRQALKLTAAERRQLARDIEASLRASKAA